MRILFVCLSLILFAAPAKAQVTCKDDDPFCPITEEQLGNMTYAIGEQTTKLNAGEFQKDDPFLQVNMVKSVPGWRMLSISDTLTRPMAMVVLSLSDGNSIVYYLAVVIRDKKGELNNVKTVYLGKGSITSLELKFPGVELQMNVHQEGDDECCPSKSESRLYWYLDTDLWERVD